MSRKQAPSTWQHNIYQPPPGPSLLMQAVIVIVVIVGFCWLVAAIGG